MTILLISLVAGVLSVLAPCVLPVIPIIFGAGLSDTHDTGKIQRILFTSMICIFAFTFLLKVSTQFIGIPQSTRNIFSGTVILLYSITLLWPTSREYIQSRLPRITPSQHTGHIGDYILGASLGPIFASCSPTYALLLGTILPADPVIGIIGLGVYVLGFGGFLWILASGGREIIKKFYGLADSTGWFKKSLGILLTLVGILILSGGMQKIEARALAYFPDTGSIESRLMDTFFFAKPDIPTSGDLLSTHSGSMTTGYIIYDGHNIPPSGDIVLFFHANRCSTCREAEKNFLADTIPAGLTIVQVDYDTATDLRVKYNILSQTSYVYIKPDGTMIKRWIGGTRLDDIITKVTVVKQPSGQTATTLYPADISSFLPPLTAVQKNILYKGGTEPPFHNAYRDKKDKGIYVDVIDGTALFSSTDKFDSGTGWPAFTRPIDESLIGAKVDISAGEERTEITSTSSKGHLGHVFQDGPSDTGGKRYCINSAALYFVPLADMKAKGYAKYLPLFH